ncbi:helix-turn-helix domain-containing protein [Streptosporangium lutulentum]
MSEIPVGERVQFYRKAQKKKQAVVAGLAGITEDYLSQIERGLKTPAMPLLHRLARVLNVPVSTLLGELRSRKRARSTLLEEPCSGFSPPTPPSRPISPCLNWPSFVNE